MTESTDKSRLNFIKLKIVLKCCESTSCKPSGRALGPQAFGDQRVTLTRTQSLGKSDTFRLCETLSAKVYP
jgi:hypothetical protein